MVDGEFGNVLIKKSMKIIRKLLGVCNLIMALLPYGLSNGIKRTICFAMLHLSRGENKRLWQARLEKFAFRSAKNVALLHRNIERVLEVVRERVGARGCVKVYFVCHEIAQFTFQGIYDAMKGLSRFDPYVFCSNQWVRSEGATENIHDYFRRKGMKTVDAVDPQSPPDVVFFCIFDKDSISISDMSALSVLCYIPYSWMLSVASDDYFWRCDKLAYFARVYTPTERESRLALSGRCIYPHAVVCSGNPKMDELAHSSAAGAAAVWKTKSAKRIIWAPHWSVGCASDLGTFDIYCRKMIDFLKVHGEIEVCLKPHPMLKARLGSQKMIEELRSKGWYWRDAIMDGKDYDLFLAEWNALPNASIMDSGGYGDLFASSDAMMLDSISFIAEYMAYNRPMCFLCKDDTQDKLKGRFNDIGWDLLSANTLAFNWDSAQKFMMDVVDGKDLNGERRLEMRDRYLMRNFGKVGEFIRDDIAKLLGLDGKEMR